MPAAPRGSTLQVKPPRNPCLAQWEHAEHNCTVETHTSCSGLSPGHDHRTPCWHIPLLLTKAASFLRSSLCPLPKTNTTIHTHFRQQRISQHHRPTQTRIKKYDNIGASVQEVTQPPPAAAGSSRHTTSRSGPVHSQSCGACSAKKEAPPSATHGLQPRPTPVGDQLHHHPCCATWVTRQMGHQPGKHAALVAQSNP